jgi:hypothetical protein
MHVAIVRIGGRPVRFWIAQVAKDGTCAACRDARGLAVGAGESGDIMARTY